MNADLEAKIAEGRRRMRQFEEKTTHQIDMFDREVDNRYHQLGHKYSSIHDDLKPVSWPLWGVVLETSGGQQIFKEHVSFESVARCPRSCSCTSSMALPSRAYMPPDPCPPLDVYSPASRSYSYERPMETTTDSLLSVESKIIMEGRRWGLNKYLYDDEYVSNPPYGIIMKRPPPPPPPEPHPSTRGLEERQPNGKLVSAYWRRKWKIPEDW